jgi:hypothetical protein
MYVDVIYFFVMRGTFIHTIFEPAAKKHLRFFPRFRKKIPLLCRSNCVVLVVDVA